MSGQGRDFITPTDFGVPFDNAGTSYISDNVHDAIIETALNAGSSRYAVIFGYNGNASAKFLELFQSNPSNTTPFVVPEVGEIASLAIATKTSTTATVSIRVNGIEVDTITLTAATSNTKSGLSYSLAAGDLISVYVSSGNVNDPAVSVNIKVI